MLLSAELFHFFVWCEHMKDTKTMLKSAGVVSMDLYVESYLKLDRYMVDWETLMRISTGKQKPSN
jgi:hypothetical protein